MLIFNLNMQIVQENKFKFDDYISIIDIKIIIVENIL